MNDPRNYVGAAFRRIYFDLESAEALRLKAAVAKSGMTQRAFLRNAVVAAITAQEKENASRKNK